MKITGKNLALVVEAIKGAIADIHYHVASCPDVIEYEDRLTNSKSSNVNINGYLTVALKL